VLSVITLGELMYAVERSVNRGTRHCGRIDGGDQQWKGIPPGAWPEDRKLGSL